MYFQLKHTTSNQKENSLTPNATRIAHRIVAFFVETRGTSLANAHKESSHSLLRFGVYQRQKAHKESTHSLLEFGLHRKRTALNSTSYGMRGRSFNFRNLCLFSVYVIKIPVLFFIDAKSNFFKVLQHLDHIAAICIRAFVDATKANGN